MGWFRFMRPIIFPALVPAGLTGGSWSLASHLIDAATEKVAIIGQFYPSGGAAKTISRVGFLPGTVTLNSASTIKISIQSVSDTSGPPYQPSGTILGATNNGFVTEAAATFTSDTWHRTAALGETVTLNPGDLVSVVIEYGTFTAADVFNVNGFSEPSGANQQTGGASIYTTSWGVGSTPILPSLVLEDNAGGFHGLQTSVPFSALSLPTFAQDNATADEWALEFTAGVSVKVSGAWLSLKESGATANSNVKLYDSGGSVLASVAIDGNRTAASNSYRYTNLIFSSDVTLTAGQVYRLAVEPTTTGSSSVGVVQIDVDNAGHWNAWGFWDAGLVKRKDAGTWTSKTTTSRFIGGLLLSAIQDGKQIVPCFGDLDAGICV